MKDIFCRIIEGEIPSAKVYEDEEVLAFLDITQSTKGHTLIVPKAHYENYLSTPPELLAHVLEVAQKVGKAQIEAFGAKGTNILSNAGEAAGQSVMHFHLHVIPRYDETDGVHMSFDEHQGTDLQDVASKIKESL